MLALMKNSDINNIKNKIFILYILNVTDIIFTNILLNTGFFNEANPFMIGLLQSAYAGIMVKIILPALLLLYLYKRMQNATNKQLRFSNVAINIITTIYALINISHLVWLFSIPIFMNL
ncbi:DUF5658 family protein [Oceanirhabdus seepicola]|uniref:DUF5658 domain-containing protein n=1 Tax=Oceanirhabdus seepicola TaxID=2828781 RepID=A0A9J6P9X0_9CLOT|nr:hypothetical protein [Oceanirhabdus seepicola]